MLVLFEIEMRYFELAGSPCGADIHRLLVTFNCNDVFATCPRRAHV